MIYFDNAATSYPKPYAVRRKMNEALRRYSFNSGRGGYMPSVKTAEKIFTVRQKIGDMLDCPPELVCFTKNCTEALNTAIKGSIVPGCHMLISSLEHNSVARVVQKLADEGLADYSVVPFSFQPAVTASRIKSAVRENTKLIICTLSSNVFGVMLPIREIGAFCREKGIRFIVDGAQGVGACPVSLTKDNIDILCVPGHKSLMGPMGTGFMAMRKPFSLRPLTEGGTGSSSLQLTQPPEVPERFEAGTLNNPGILSLGSALDYIFKTGMENIYRHEMLLTGYLYERLSEIKKVILYTPFPQMNSSTAVLSFNYGKQSAELTAARLSESGICVRAGYHCAPLAHRSFHTLDTGTVRISPGWFNTKKDCDRFLNVVKKL